MKIYRNIAFLVVFLLGDGAARGQGVVTLDTLMTRAQAYVAAYEEELGALIAEEEYVQTAVWLAGVAGGRPGSILSGPNVSGAARGNRQQRRLSSDFLLLLMGEQWYSVRNVLRVDGIAVEVQPKDFTPEFAESPAAIMATLNDNARYNIGDFQRTINVPTFTLTILRPDNIGRFSFEKDGEKRFDNVNAWEIRFTEQASPTLVEGLNGEDRFAKGKLWVEPDSGRILQTEITFEAKASSTSYRARIAVSYEPNSELAMLVPKLMQERYESDRHYVESRADYSNFKRFKVEINSEFNLDSLTQ